MGIDCSSCKDHALSGDDFCRHPDFHSRCDTVHDAWVPRLADARNASISDGNVCFDDASVIYNDDVRDHNVRSAVSSGSCWRLTHPISQYFSTPENGFIAVDGVVFLNFGKQLGVTEPNLIPNCGSKVLSIVMSFHAHDVSPSAYEVGGSLKGCLADFCRV